MGISAIRTNMHAKGERSSMTRSCGRSRRQVLATVGGALSLSGCVLNETDGVRREDGVRHEFGEARDVGGRSVVLENVSVRKSIPALISNHVDVAAFEGDQFVVADARAVDGSPLDAALFGFDVAGRDVDSKTYLRDGAVSGENPLPLGFRVPTADYAAAAITWSGPDDPDVRWELPERIVGALGREPAFEVRRFEVPRQVSVRDPVPATVEVANGGERDGVFLAELGVAVSSDVGETRYEVAAGETVTRRESLQTHGASGELRVVLDWGFDRRSRTVNVED